MDIEPYHHKGSYNCGTMSKTAELTVKIDTSDITTKVYTRKEIYTRKTKN